MLIYRTKTKDGGRAKVELMKFFQSPLAPEERTLALSATSALWWLNPLVCEEDEFQSPPANLRDSAPGLIPSEKNEALLLELHKSFRRAASSLHEGNFTSIMQCLADSFNVEEDAPVSEDLRVYFVKRLGGTGHGDATPTSHVDRDKLVEQSSLLKGSPERKGVAPRC